MAEEKVLFLGEEYSFPDELREYIKYCEQFEKCNNRLMAILSKQARKGLWGYNSEEDAEFKQAMKDEGQKVIGLLAENKIFDVTLSELVEDNDGYKLFVSTCKETLEAMKQILIRAMQGWQEGYDNAVNSAYSQVTGSGVRVFTSSIAAGLTYAAFESSTIKKQCNAADREYQSAIGSLNSQINDEQDRQEKEYLKNITYPQTSEAIVIFTSQLMDKFLSKLNQHGVFNYEKIKNFDMKRSSELLQNTKTVSDKESVLKQAFVTCPYNPDIYQQVLQFGLCDVDTFETAQYFYQDKILRGIVEDYCKSNLKNYDKIKEAIKIMVLYRNESEIDVLSMLYYDELESIKKKYKIFSSVISSKKELDKWIRNHISKKMNNIIKTSVDTIKGKIHSEVSGIITEQSYIKFINMELIIVADIRLDDSTETDLSKINAEIEEKLSSCVNEYVQEAISRKQKYDEANNKYLSSVKTKADAIAEKQSELSKLGMFALGKKKELKGIIADMESELSKFKADNEPKDLQVAFEEMYR